MQGSQIGSLLMDEAYRRTDTVVNTSDDCESCLVMVTQVA